MTERTAGAARQLTSRERQPRCLRWIDIGGEVGDARRVAREDRDKWDARYSGESIEERNAPAWIEAIDLPRAGRALDVAAGSGRIAVWAARRGLHVVAVDVSPIGLALARERARREGLSLATIALDLEEEPLPEGPFELITCFHYRQPSLWTAMKARLAPGGLLVAELPTVTNLERHAHPSERWLVQPGELLAWAEGLEIVVHDEGWHGDRHVARLAARAPG